MIVYRIKLAQLLSFTKKRRNHLKIILGEFWLMNNKIYVKLPTLVLKLGAIVFALKMWRHSLYRARLKCSAIMRCT
jgi:hypothetical protein